LVVCAAPAASAASFQAETRTFYSTVDGLPSNDVRSLTLRDGRLFAVTPAGVAVFADGRFTPAATPIPLEGGRQTVDAPDGRAARGSAEGLYLREKGGAWQALHRTAREAGLPSTCAA
jgi:hypothetical protein